jgi:hypothetical protein
MTNDPSIAGSDTLVPPLGPEVRRQRVKVRRRREGHRHGQQAKWKARSRRRAVQTAFLCTVALGLMTVGLCLGLSRPSTPAATGGVIRVRAVP